MLQTVGQRMRFDQYLLDGCLERAESPLKKLKWPAESLATFLVAVSAASRSRQAAFDFYLIV